MEITVDDVLNAIEKNGLPKAKGSYFYFGAGSIKIAGCAFGQAALNLGITEPLTLRLALNSLSYKMENEIIRLNDNTDLSLPEIAIAIRNMYKPGFRRRKIKIGQ